MQKTFCDICDKPADAKREYRCEMPVGAPVREYRTRPDGSGCEANWQTRVVVTASFSFVDHAISTAKPDLCEDCAQHLLKKLAGEVPVPAPLPGQSLTELDRGCSEELRRAGQAYPRTCAKCGLGPCHHRQKP